MTQKQAIKYWENSAEKNWEVAKSLYESEHYDWSLFMCHLLLEKLLKGLIVKNKDKSPPFIHNLLRLAKEAEINLTEEKKEDLEEINTFNLQARDDDYKFSFYKKATKEYTTKWFKKIKEYRKWLKNRY